MRPHLVALGILALAGPAAAQPFILPLQKRAPAEAPPPPPSPAPVAPPQADAAPGADARSTAAANPQSASGATDDQDAQRTPAR